MISEVNTLEASGLRPAFPSFVPTATPSASENVEGEINRLTWAVLDGSASPTDRNRLSELVRAQHALRRPAGI